MRLSRADLIKVKEIAEKYNLSVDHVKEIIGSPYEFIHKTAKELDFSDELTREEFDNKKTNFNIPSIGKLYASHYLYSEIIKNKNKK